MKEIAPGFLGGGKMSVQTLGAASWREYRGKPASAGLNETTHLAKVVNHVSTVVAVLESKSRVSPQWRVVLTQGRTYNIVGYAEICPSADAHLMSRQATDK